MTAASSTKKRASSPLSEEGKASPSALTGLVPGGQAVLGRLAKLGIRDPFDLVLHLPLRYEDETHLSPIADARPYQTVQVEGTVVHTEVLFRPRRTLVCRIEDASGTLFMRFLNFYGSQVKTLAPGRRVRVLGELRPGFFGAEMVHPRYRLVKDDDPLSSSLTPVYPTTAGLAQGPLRKAIGAALEKLDLSDTLPASLLDRLGLPGFSDSVRYLHEPPPDASLAALSEGRHPAWRRLKFDELLAQQLSMRLHRQSRAQLQAPSFPARSDLETRFRAALPFSLTGAQERALEEIGGDLARAHPMQRLLQGDVGSGKTVVAALAALRAIGHGYQAAVMAPTEILAEQHFRKLSAWCEPLGVRVAWLAASLSKKEKKETLARVAAGEAKLVAGTHALFQDQVSFARLGLVVVDEQHRFGVEQRLALRLKGEEPHQLMMSATPIPRTLSMSYYADLDVSVIDELPPGRTPVVTRLVADDRREEVILRVRHACLTGRQAYWVCPLIEQSEALQLKTALETFEQLSGTFPDLRVGLVHGRMPPKEKAGVMGAFLRGELHLLVATTVIEVGVDVPNASLMVIEHAERMGLSQLHQLRGRVGRGAEKSACILLYQGPLSETARARLKIIYENTDGFEIARQDLQLRGPGEFLGARQSGVPMLRFADLTADIDLLEAARDAAGTLLQTHPDLAERHLARWLSRRQEYLRV